MKRLAAMVLMLGALAAPLPLFAAGMGCGPVHACCTAERIKASEVDCCETSMCTDPEPARPGVVPAGPVNISAVESTVATTDTVRDPIAGHPVIAPSPPAETRVRLATLSTLLI